MMIGTFIFCWIVVAIGVFIFAKMFTVVEDRRNIRTTRPNSREAAPMTNTEREHG